MAKKKLPAWATWEPKQNDNEADFLSFSKNLLNNNENLDNFNSLREDNYQQNLQEGNNDATLYQFNPNEDDKENNYKYDSFIKNSPLNLPKAYGGTAPDISTEQPTKSLPTPIKKEKQGFWGSLGSGLTQGLAEGEKNFLNMVKTPYSLLSNGIAKALNYDNSNNVVLKGFNKADTTYNDVINDEANKDRSTEGNIAFKGGNLVGNGAILATELALPVPKAGTLGNVYSDSVGQLGNLASNSILKSGLKAGAEMGTMGAVENALTLPAYDKPVTNQDVLDRYKNISTAGLEGAASGFAFGAGGKALGNLKTSALPKWETTFEDSISNHLKNNGELMPKASELPSPISKLETTKMPSLDEPTSTTGNTFNRYDTSIPPKVDTPKMSNNPFLNRTLENVGSKDIKAVSYENPSVKPFIQEQASMLQQDLGEGIKGGHETTYNENGTIIGGRRVSRNMSEGISSIKDSTGASYDKINTALQKIVDDHGQENNALSKKIEVIINDRLSNGYTDSYGYEANKNYDYLASTNSLNTEAMSKDLKDIRSQMDDVIKTIQSDPTYYDKGINEIEKLSYKEKELSDALNKHSKLPSLDEPTTPIEDIPQLSNTNLPLPQENPSMNLQNHSGMNLNAMHEGMLDNGDKEMFKERTGREASEGDMKDRQTVVNSFMNSEAIPNEVKTKLQEDPQAYKYIEHNNEQAMNNAREEVSNSFDKVKTHVENLTSLENDQDTARALEIERQLIKNGDFEGAKQWSLKVARLGTKSGQAIQYFSTLKRMTPEWTLNHVQNMVDKTLTPKQRTILENAKPEEVDAIAKKFKIPHLSEEATKKLVDMSNKISELPEGRGKNEAISNLQQYAYDQVPHSVLSYINSVQTNAMLSSPKTAVRNFVSNLMFGGITDVKNSVRTGLDKGIGAFTKERTSTLPSLPQKIKGFAEGTKESLLDFKNNVDTRNTDKMELTRGSVWNKNGNLLNKSMYNIEKTNKLLLSDRGFEGSAYNDEFARQKKLAKLNGVEFDGIKADAKAKQAALYQTFNDDSAMSGLAVGAKRNLNILSNSLLTGKGTGKNLDQATKDKFAQWGAGDIILKFAKTPANIAQRAWDYSVGGLVSSVRAAVGKGGFNQEAFADNLAKSTTGAGLVGIGYALHKMGVLNTDEEKNYNAQALKAKAGLNNFQINISALNRFINGGSVKLQKGDTLATYDWAQPVSILMALGGNLNSQNKGVVSTTSTILDGLASGVNGFIDQPLTQGLSTLFGSHDIAGAINKYIAGIPQTFVPSIVNNVKQLVNNQGKETYSPDTFKQGLNQAKNRLPGNSLPNKVDIMGQKKETFQNGSNNLFNVLINPANTTKYEPTKQTENALNLYNKVGGGDVLPKLAPKKLILDGKSYKLPTPVYQQYQRDLGDAANKIYDDDTLSEKQANSLLRKASTNAKENAIKSLNLPLPEKKKTASKGHHYIPGK